VLKQCCVDDATQNPASYSGAWFQFPDANGRGSATHEADPEGDTSGESDMGEIDLSSPAAPADPDPGGGSGPAGLLRQVALGGAAARLVGSVAQTAALLPLSQKVGEVGGTLWERSSGVRSTLKAVSREERRCVDGDSHSTV
jgi:hypothetical protein